MNSRFATYGLFALVVWLGGMVVFLHCEVVALGRFTSDVSNRLARLERAVAHLQCAPPQDEMPTSVTSAEADTDLSTIRPLDTKVVVDELLRGDEAAAGAGFEGVSEDSLEGRALARATSKQHLYSPFLKGLDITPELRKQLEDAVRAQVTEDYFQSSAVPEQRDAELGSMVRTAFHAWTGEILGDEALEALHAYEEAMPRHSATQVVDIDLLQLDWGVDAPLRASLRDRLVEELVPVIYDDLFGDGREDPTATREIYRRVLEDYRVSLAPDALAPIERYLNLQIEQEDDRINWTAPVGAAEH